MTLNVRFFFGIGNWYSYLAATQLNHSIKATGATFFPAVSLEGARRRLLLLDSAEIVEATLSPLNHVVGA